MDKGSSSCPRSREASTILCCMCGDHGLKQELFQCTICFVRSQHKYCSDLYPKGVIYQTCNWCLRDEGGEKIISRDYNTNKHEIDNLDNCHAKILRREYISRLNKPIKKKKTDGNKPPVRIVIRRSGLKKQEPQLENRGKKKGRPKVRRYKLLEEVTR